MIASGETPELSDFALTSVVIDLDSENPVDPDKPVNPDKPVLSDALTLLCFGEYSEATNILEIYWKSNFNAPVSIYENNDGIGWNKIAEVADDTAYNHEINENFLIKQIKVSQETENGVIEYASTKDKLKTGVADIGGHELKNNDIAFFCEKNPDYVIGNDLACLAKIDKSVLKKRALALLFNER